MKHIEERLATAAMSPVVQQALQDLLNLVEHLVADQQTAMAEVQRLRQQLEDKKKAKTTTPPTGDQPPTNHSSEQPRRNRQPPPARPAEDRRTFKELTIHEEIECPVDPQQLPPDVQRCDDERVIIQNIRIGPRNICFRRHVYYCAAEQKYYRGPLPAGFGPGDFGPDLQALILALKYCGNMSEPKIREFLENFDVQISSGSLSNILTNTAAAFEGEVQDLVLAGLGSTGYQQTDDTAARVAGQFWHTHILCNPFYTAYFTRAHKDRLTVLAVLQLQQPTSLRFRFNAWTRALLERWETPQKWRDRVAALGDDVEFDGAALRELLDSWFGEGAGGAARDDLEQAAAIAYYRQQTAVPVVQTLVCDAAAQFKWLTEYLALCWIHEGRHYARLTPVVPQHAALLKEFGEQFWDYYAALERYRQHPTAEEAERLRQQFDELFSRRTGYEALDERIAKTAAKKDELLTVLSQPSVPLHNNASELGARVSARRRDISLHSKSERGAHAMDIFTTVVQTCKKLGVSAYAYLRDRLSGRRAMRSLADLIRAAAAAAARAPPGRSPATATAGV